MLSDMPRASATWAATATLTVQGILGSITRPMDWIVELDECATDALEAARLSRVNLESIAS